MKLDTKKAIDLIAQALYDKKASNIVAMKVEGFSTITDYIIVAEGNVDRHIDALAKSVKDALIKEGEKPAYTEGGSSGSEWVVLDYFEIMVHLFLPAIRQKYQIERLYPDGEIIELEFSHRETSPAVEQKSPSLLNDTLFEEDLG